MGVRLVKSSVYLGRFHEGSPVVTVRSNGMELPLNPRHDLRNHSPTGFAWGYCGSGPSQLALAILAHHFGPGRHTIALLLYHRFKEQVLSRLDADTSFSLDSSVIREECKAIRKQLRGYHHGQ